MREIRVQKQLVVAVLVLAACGSARRSGNDDDNGETPTPSPSYGSMTGSVLGQSLDVKDAIWFTLKSDDAEDPTLWLDTTIIALSSVPDLCSNYRRGVNPSGMTGLSLSATRRANSRDLPLIEGEYMVTAETPEGDGKHARVGFEKNGPTCEKVLTESQSIGTEGTLTITHAPIDPSDTLNATLTAVVGTQRDAISATIHARYCDISQRPSGFSCE